MNLEYRQVAPAPGLRPYVRHYWLLAGTGLNADAHPVFPDGCPEIVFNLGPPSIELLPSGRRSTQPAAMLVGQMLRPVLMVPGSYLRMVGVKLEPWGAAAILGEGSTSVRDASASLGEVGAGVLEHSPPG
ncbi:MAG: DUF6597 domain-containing transcriptional factor [Gemmatimonadales bacterium]